LGDQRFALWQGWPTVLGPSHVGGGVGFFGTGVFVGCVVGVVTVIASELTPGSLGWA
jgi:hypothetical protein